MFEKNRKCDVKEMFAPSQSQITLKLNLFLI